MIVPILRLSLLLLAVLLAPPLSAQNPEEKTRQPRRQARFLAIGDSPPFAQEIRDGVRYELEPPPDSIPPRQVSVSLEGEAASTVDLRLHRGSPPRTDQCTGEGTTGGGALRSAQTRQRSTGQCPLAALQLPGKWKFSRPAVSPRRKGNLGETCPPGVARRDGGQRAVGESAAGSKPRRLVRTAHRARARESPGIPHRTRSQRSLPGFQ